MSQQSRNRRLASVCFLGLTLASVSALAQKESAPVSSVAPTHGHSMIGDVFNEGPRQHAYLMKGMSNVSFKVTTKSPLVQKFFNQGLAQLHGFWYFEAERSFRQAATLDPDCASAYWGMALANINNQSRAKQFVKKRTIRSESERARAELDQRADRVLSVRQTCCRSKEKLPRQHWRKSRKLIQMISRRRLFSV